MNLLQKVQKEQNSFMTACVGHELYLSTQIMAKAVFLWIALLSPSCCFLSGPSPFFVQGYKIMFCFFFLFFSLDYVVFLISFETWKILDHQKANALPPPVVIVYAACWFFYLFSKEADGVARCELEQKCKPIRQKL